METIWQLQSFNHASGMYSVEFSGTDKSELKAYARENFSAWRIVNVNREKPLPLKPKAPYGMGGNRSARPRPRWQWKHTPVKPDLTSVAIPDGIVETCHACLDSLICDQCA